MQEGLERPKTPTNDVWMAWAVPDWATGGAGFTQQDVGVCALLHQPSCTHKRSDTHSQSQLSHKDDVLGGTGFLHASSWKWHVSLRRGIKRLQKGEEYVSLAFSVPCVYKYRNTKTEATPGLNQIYTHKCSQDLCSCARSVSALVDCGPVFCTGL